MKFDYSIRYWDEEKKNQSKCHFSFLFWFYTSTSRATKKKGIILVTPPPLKCKDVCNVCIEVKYPLRVGEGCTDLPCLVKCMRTKPWSEGGGGVLSSSFHAFILFSLVFWLTFLTYLKNIYMGVHCPCAPTNKVTPSHMHTPSFVIYSVCIMHAWIRALYSSYGRRWVNPSSK